jgi:peroxiredoxin Q/BCP
MKAILVIAIIFLIVLVLKKPAFGNEAKLLGQVAPDFNLKNSQGESVSLASFQGQWLVVFFYPKDDTPGCTAEACSFRDNYDDIKKLNASIVGISVDSSESHQKFKEKHNLPFMLLADEGGNVAKQYGALNNFLIFKFAKRQSFIIDPEGLIRRVYRSVSPSKHALEIKEDLQQLIENS